MSLLRRLRKRIRPTRKECSLADDNEQQLLDSHEQLQLCDHCKSLDFQTPFRTACVSQELGYLNDITARAPICSFCDLVAFVVKARLKESRFSSLPAELPILCRLDAKSTSRGTDCFTDSMPSIRFWDEAAKYVEYVGRQAKCALQFARFPVPIADQSAKCTRGLQRSGRMVNPTVCISLLRSWVEICELNHKSCQLPPWQAPSEWPSGIRLVDVVELSIVEAPRRCRYAALSYVWGKSTAIEYFCPAKNNIFELNQKGSLPLHQLPQTVRDAIELVGRMMERYIWVDFLCIVQDDPADFDRQINQMDTIYSNATFTICAATAADAAHGLPCLNTARHSLQRFSQVGPRYCLGTMFEQDTEYLYNIWRTRGWTCQEDILSKRQLIFTDHQVFWRCLEDHWREEAIHEPSDAAQKGHSDFLDLYDGNELFDKDRSRFSLSNYPSIVAEYNKRAFTNEADVVVASKGFIRRTAMTSGESIHWGLPQTKFEEALLWTPFGRAQRRSCNYVPYTSDGTVQEFSIPSWSWLGWNCQVSWSGTTLQSQWYRKFSIDDRVKRNSALTWYKLGISGERRCLSRPLLESDNIARPLPLWKCALKQNPTEHSEPESQFVDSGRLLVETSNSSLRIRKCPSRHLDQYDGSHSRALTHPFQILDATGQIVGGMACWLGGDDDTFGQEAEVCEFIVISEYGMPKHQRHEKGTLEVVGVRYELDLLRINWDSQGLASRRGIFSIMEDDWMRSGPQWRRVVLQ